MPDANTAKIAALNDRARQRLDHCRWILTQGVLSCDPITVAELLIAVEDFDATLHQTTTHMRSTTLGSSSSQVTRSFGSSTTTI